MKPRIDPDICIGCTLCVQTAPEVFKMEGEKAVVFINPVPKEAEQSYKQAADDCPVTAISIE